MKTDSPVLAEQVRNVCLVSKFSGQETSDKGELHHSHVCIIILAFNYIVISVVIMLKSTV